MGLPKGASIPFGQGRGQYPDREVDWLIWRHAKDSAPGSPALTEGGGGLAEASYLLPPKSVIRQKTSSKLSLFKDITRLYNSGHKLTIATNERILKYFWTLRRPGE